MIDIENIADESPLIEFRNRYNNAIKNNQKDIQALNVASWSKDKNEIDSRYVNLKFIIDDKFIFFTNYDSPKSHQFNSHNQVALSFYWETIKTQIRIKAFIKKTSLSFNNSYYKNRAWKKNALAISSKQSKVVSSYDIVLEDYQKIFHSKKINKCPNNWGGFSCKPYYFEFWEGHESRINKREVFDKIDGIWKHSFLQP